LQFDVSSKQDDEIILEVAGLTAGDRSLVFSKLMRKPNDFAQTLGELTRLRTPIVCAPTSAVYHYLVNVYGADLRGYELITPWILGSFFSDPENKKRLIRELFELHEESDNTEDLDLEELAIYLNFWKRIPYPTLNKLFAGPFTLNDDELYDIMKNREISYYVKSFVLRMAPQDLKDKVLYDVLRSGNHEFFRTLLVHFNMEPTLEVLTFCLMKPLLLNQLDSFLLRRKNGDSLSVQESNKIPLLEQQLRAIGVFEIYRKEKLE
jgi:hypothetical protein